MNRKNHPKQPSKKTKNESQDARRREGNVKHNKDVKKEEWLK